ncbi:MAG: class I SAM-dependent methyltransferase [Paracoccaceae bacterium]|nr:class I SAM-dependent methyltransferase [Paracoccaceae bacterium]
MTDFDEFKAKAKAVWSDFATMENFTGVAAPRLVKFANVSKEQRLLDVAGGTGVVALTAARTGAKVTGSDLTPELVKRAKENNEIFNLDVDFHEADVEDLPFEDESFDVVLSQFGHMFAPRPEVALREMLRVLKPGGNIAFSTWPPELFMGIFFKINAKYGPPPPEGMQSPVLWGNVDIIYERLGSSVSKITFDRDKLVMPGLSVQHVRTVFETTAGPLKKMVQAFASEPNKLTNLRDEIDNAISNYFEDNFLRMDYLMTRARKV